MLTIVYGEVDGAINDPDTYFNHTYSQKWFEDPFVKEMIRAVDKSEVLSSHAIESPVLGIIPTSKLSGGVKALILVYKKPELLIDCTACGENCAEWILKIAENQNTLINLNYFMDFPEPFELQNVYSSTLSYPPRLITPDYVLCEDSNSGLEMFHALAEKVSAECHSAHGKSNIPEKVLDFEENKTYLIIVDGAAYGPEMGATVRYIEDHFNCYLYAPESFEWLLLKVMFSKDPMIYRILKNPSDYTESTKYLSWERYFTHVLEEHTKGTELEYHKKKLNKQYLYARAMKILSKFLLDSNINFDRCMV